MKIGSPKETADLEARVALTPESAGQLVKLGHECVVESGAGEKSGYTDEAYRLAGVDVIHDAAALFSAAQASSLYAMNIRHMLLRFSSGLQRRIYRNGNSCS